MKPKSNQLVVDRKLWLGDGNAAIEARAELYHTGTDVFDLYLSLGGQVPVRYQGSLGLMMNKGQHFVDARKAQGYQEATDYASKEIKN